MWRGTIFVENAIAIGSCFYKPIEEMFTKNINSKWQIG